mmetsp:Transcript_48578/g.128470  ORF Transcript_48578/g.128470 Transcript_48578/m.128470 type:complete len:107 (-) Transcript_48578:212-532(-)
MGLKNDVRAVYISFGPNLQQLLLLQRTSNSLEGRNRRNKKAVSTSADTREAAIFTSYISEPDDVRRSIAFGGVQIYLKTACTNLGSLSAQIPSVCFLTQSRNVYLS